MDIYLIKSGDILGVCLKVRSIFLDPEIMSVYEFSFLDKAEKRMNSSLDLSQGARKLQI